jgi:RNA polymerase sigma-70 factor, ECF subfamily
VTGSALDQIFRQASGRIVAALAAQFRDLSLAEDAFSESCVRALEVWPNQDVPRDPAAWLYQVAVRAALDVLRRRRTQDRFAPQLLADITEFEAESEDSEVIPDERLRLIFVCCHPAVAVDARAALTLRLVCGLSTLEIARAFLVPEATLAQRLVRAKRKITDAGVPFEVPRAELWPERLDAVLSTLEVAYAKAHEDAAGGGPHANYALEILELTRVLSVLVPLDPEVLALAATTRYAEARRPSRTDSNGAMIPLSEQDPALWRPQLIAEANAYLNRAVDLDPDRPRVVQAAIHSLWCARKNLAEPPPWPTILALYDSLLRLRDDPIIRLNRAVVVAEVAGVDAAVLDIEAIEMESVQEFLPYHAVRADLLRRAGRYEEAGRAYDRAISLVATPAERKWLTKQRESLPSPKHSAH